MAERSEQSHQYSYASYASLVLQPNRPSGSSNEPTGEPESLRGRRLAPMGDRVAYAKPTELLDAIAKRRAKRAESEGGRGMGDGAGDLGSDLTLLAAGGAPSRLKKRRRAANILEATADLDTDVYRPKTRETRLVWEALLSLVKQRLGDQPQDILRSAADEVLAVLKDDGLRDRQRKTAIEEYIMPMDDKMFHRVVELGKGITDYVEVPMDGLDATAGALGEEIAVVFGDDDEDGENAEGMRGDYYLEEADPEDVSDSEEAGQDTDAVAPLQADGDLAGDQAQGTQGPQRLVATAIDAYWLQRNIGKTFADPQDALEATKRVLDILGQPTDVRTCENELVGVLDFDRFDLVRLLLHNRDLVYWATRYKGAQSEDARAQVEAEMEAQPERLGSILDALRGRVAVNNGAGAMDEGADGKDDRASRSKKGKGKGKGKAEAEEPPAWRAARRMLDLEELAFDDGSHVMTNKDCSLPEGAFRTSKKGYEVVHIPAVKAPPFDDDSERLIPIDELPEWAQGPFRPTTKSGEEDQANKITHLNRIQSRVYHAALFTPENMLLCAPTGAGKTNCALLTMLHEIGLNRDPDTGRLDLDAFKIVYVAPMKSLVQEMVLTFGRRLACYGITVAELSGDQNLTKAQIASTQVIVTTPEKWDIITRKSGDRAFTQLVRLVIIDEIHLLHDDRGPVLESIVARTIRQVEATQEMVRLVGLSATLPNHEDVAMFLRVNDDNLFHFDNRYRPCPLEATYVGINVKKGLKRFQLMNQLTYEHVMQRAGKHQIIVFVHSRKETAKTAQYLRDMALANDELERFVRQDSASREILAMEAEDVASPALRDLLPYGFACHHAGMKRADRTRVEDLFADNHVQVLVSTATLAWGVNLPAHCVIIKGTQVYNPEKGAWVELSALDMMQMMGRAGRPQYDTTGEGVIITSHSELQYYLSLLNEQLPIESQMVSKLPDHLLAEVVLGTVRSVEEAVTWLGYTYLYICMLRSPTLYGVSQDEWAADRLLEARRADLVHTAASMLGESGLIHYDASTGSFQVTDLGRVAAHYYVSHATMATYNAHLKPSMNDIELFRLFSLSSEFRNITVRQQEKAELEALLTRVPIPVKEGIEDPAAKVNVLLQTYVARLRLDGFALMADMTYITQSATRLMRALHEIVLKRGWAQLAHNVLDVANMCAHRMWRTQSPLRQFHDTGPTAVPLDIVRRLEKRDFPWERLYDLNSQEIGELIRFPGQGKNVWRHIHMFPRLDLAAHVQPITRATLAVELTITPDFRWVEEHHGGAQGFWVTVEDTDGEVILHHQYFLLKAKLVKQDHVLTFTVPMYDPTPPQYFIRVQSDRWLGSVTTLPISFRHLIPPAKFPPHTELLDLQPLPVSALDNAQYEALYADAFKAFNPVQTQLFKVLYKSDNNVFVGATAGSGKSVCAELALLRLWREQPGAKAVYVAPQQATVTKRLAAWQRRFGVGLDKIVLELTGDSATDLRLLGAADVVLATPQQWDVLSRRWKQRRAVQNVALFLVDDLHLIGSEPGPVMEVIVSRMRYVSSRAEKPSRLVALSSSVANARDLGDWIGAGPHTYNFHPNVRPVPLELHMQGFHQHHFGTRITAMVRPLLQHVLRNPVGAPVLVFVHSRQQVLLTARELRIACDAEADRRRFAHLPEAELDAYVQGVRNRTLRTLLVHYGIGFVHEAMPVAERDVVVQLYESGAISMLVSSRQMAAGLPVKAHLVVLQGTQYYDGAEHRHVDYPVTDVMQMLGRAGRPGVDERAKGVILCNAPRKEYYKQFLSEPLPVESHLDSFLHDHVAAEIVTRTIQNKQDAVDYLTWTFLYRRLTQNPNFYNLQGTSHRHLSDFLSELVENTLEDLELSKCITIEDDMNLSALNLGMIAAYYYISYTTIELFSTSLTAVTRMKGLIEILSAASEFDRIPVRRHEARKLRKMAAHLPMKIDTSVHGFDAVSTKVNILLQAHFSRYPLSPDLHADQRAVLLQSLRLVQAMVDVVSSEGWLAPALACMELSQMLVQAMWETDSPLRQLPFLSKEKVGTATERGVASVFDFMDLEDDERAPLVEGVDDTQLQAIAAVCNRYPNVMGDFQVSTDADDVREGSPVSLVVQLDRELDEDEKQVGPVHCPFYPKPKQESWWLVIGEPSTNTLLAVKRVTLHRTYQGTLEFLAPAQGPHELLLYCLCDSYAGCDQEFDVELKVLEADEESDDDDDMSDEEAEAQEEA